MRTHVPLSTALYNRLALRHHPLETARCLGNLEGWRAEGGVGVGGWWEKVQDELLISWCWRIKRFGHWVCDYKINMKHKLKKFDKKVVLWNRKVAEISSISKSEFSNLDVSDQFLKRTNFREKMRRNSKVILFMAIFWAGGLVYLVKNGDKSPNKQVRPI